MITLRNILDAKGNEIFRIKPDTTVFEALKLMGEKNVGALLVMEGDHIKGIVSERDYARKVILKGKTSKETLVRDIMTIDVKTVTADQSVFQCMEIFTTLRVRHLPVMDDGQLKGIISIGDVVKAVISDQQETIQHLKNYISGNH